MGGGADSASPRGDRRRRAFFRRPAGGDWYSTTLVAAFRGAHLIKPGCDRYAGDDERAHLGQTGFDRRDQRYRVAAVFLPLGDTGSKMDSQRVGWIVAIHLTFVISGLLLATMDWITAKTKEHPSTNGDTRSSTDDGIEITAVHNHLLRTSPAVFYLHVGGHGDPVKLAHTLHAGLALSRTPFAAAPPAAAPPTIDLDTAAIDTALNAKGTINGGVYQFNIPRAEVITEAGMAVPPSMGTAIAINFQPTGSGKAAITGDFVLLGEEVNPVLKAMRDNGIEVTALHSHMIDDSPHLFFMHFWANDEVAKLAHGLKAALDLANIKHGS
jgi:hypothetical protein